RESAGVEAVRREEAHDARGARRGELPGGRIARGLRPLDRGVVAMACDLDPVGPVAQVFGNAREAGLARLAEVGRAGREERVGGQAERESLDADRTRRRLGLELVDQRLLAGGQRALLVEVALPRGELCMGVAERFDLLGELIALLAQVLHLLGQAVALAGQGLALRLELLDALGQAVALGRAVGTAGQRERDQGGERGAGAQCGPSPHAAAGIRVLASASSMAST